MNTIAPVTIFHLAYLALAIEQRSKKTHISWEETIKSLPLLQGLATHVRQLEMIEELLPSLFQAERSGNFSFPERVGSFELMQELSQKVCLCAKNELKKRSVANDYSVWTELDWLTFTWVLVFFRQARVTSLRAKDFSKRLIHLDVHCFAIYFVIACGTASSDRLLPELLNAKEISQLQGVSNSLKDGLSFRESIANWQFPSIAHKGLLQRLLNLSSLPLGLPGVEKPQHSMIAKNTLAAVRAASATKAGANLVSIRSKANQAQSSQIPAALTQTKEVDTLEQIISLVLFEEDEKDRVEQQREVEEVGSKPQTALPQVERERLISASEPASVACGRSANKDDVATQPEKKIHAPTAPSASNAAKSALGNIGKHNRPAIRHDLGVNSPPVLDSVGTVGFILVMSFLLWFVQRDTYQMGVAWWHFILGVTTCGILFWLVMPIIKATLHKTKIEFA